MIEHSSKSKGYLPMKSGPNMMGFDMGKSGSLMEMMQVGGQPSRGAAILARSRQRRADLEKLEDQQRAEAKRQKRGGLFGSIGGLAGGLLGAALAPVTGGASLALVSGLGTALGRRLGEGIGAGKTVQADTEGTVYAQDAFDDLTQASRDYTRGMGERAIASGLKAAATAGLAPGGGIYGKVGGKLATSQARQALAEAIPMAIKQAPSSLMSMFQGSPTASLPVAPNVERITDLPSIAGDLVDPSASAKIFDPSSVFPASTYNPMASPADTLLGDSDYVPDTFSLTQAVPQFYEDGGLIEYQNGGSVNIQQILQDAGVTASPEQLALFEQFDPTQLSRATEAISDNLLGMTSGQGLASAGSGFGAQMSPIGEAIERSQRSLDQQREDQQKAFESGTLQQLAIEEDQGVRFDTFNAPPPTVSSLPTSDQGAVTFNNIEYVWDSETGQYVTRDVYEQGLADQQSGQD